MTGSKYDEVLYRKDDEKDISLRNIVSYWRHNINGKKDDKVKNF